ncbi:6502_t:CDS:2, partial [Racocetra persica]
MAVLTISPTFRYQDSDNAKELLANLSGTDKENRRWVAREIQSVDIQNYEKLLSDKTVVKYFSLERPWTSDETKARLKIWENRYKEGHPHGNEEGVSEVAYVLSPEYWNRGIGQSVLSKIVDDWGTEV